MHTFLIINFHLFCIFYYISESRGKRFLRPLKSLDRPWGPSSFLFNEYRRSLPVVKRLVHEVNHSSPPSFEVKNEWIYTSAFPICLHGIDVTHFLEHDRICPNTTKLRIVYRTCFDLFYVCLKFIFFVFKTY
jgi:hypothetical protein